MKKRIFILTVAFLMVFVSVCEATTDPTAYYMFSPPYEEMQGVRAMQNMPEPFSVETTKFKTCVARAETFSSDTEYSDFSGIYMGSATYEDGAIKFEKTTADDDMTMFLTYAPSEGINAGDTYAFTCKIKTLGLENSVAKTILAARDANGTWLDEVNKQTQETKTKLGDNDWYELTQYMTVPDGTARLVLQAYLSQSAIGTVYYKDFELFKVGTDPIDNVLVRPNYKGLIYGDGYGDIDLDVVIRKQKDIFELDKMSLRVQLVDKNDKVIYYSDCTKLDEKMNFVFSSAGLSEGDYYLQSILKDLSGNVLCKEESTIRKRAKNYRPDVYVDENSHYIDEDGNKRFLINMYNHDSTSINSTTTPIVQDAIDFDLDAVSEYGAGWWLLGKERNLTHVNSLKNAGKKLHMTLSYLLYSNLSTSIGKKLIEKQEDTVPLISEIVKEYADEDYLLGYYLYDEPYPFITGEEYRWLNEILAEFDINHPTFGAACYDCDKYGAYVKMSDFLGVDPYPIKGKTDSSGNPADDIAEVGRSVRMAKENFPNRPVRLVLQTFNWKSQGSGYSSARTPTEEELRNMMWQGVCEGAEGLDAFSYASLYDDPERTYEEWREILIDLYKEVRTYEDAIMSDEPAPLYQVEDEDDWLNITLRRYNGKTYIFAVNNTYENGKKATVKIDGVAEPVELEFNSLDVQIKEITHTDYLSPEAELEVFGVSNGNRVFSVVEDSEKTLYVPKNNDILNYSIKVSDGAKAYFGITPLSETGKMTIRNMDDFTVTVVAADGKTKTNTTYKIVRQ